MGMVTTGVVTMGDNRMVTRGKGDIGDGDNGRW